MAAADVTVGICISFVQYNLSNTARENLWVFFFGLRKDKKKNFAASKRGYCTAAVNPTSSNCPDRELVFTRSTCSFIVSLQTIKLVKPSRPRTGRRKQYLRQSPVLIRSEPTSRPATPHPPSNAREQRHSTKPSQASPNSRVDNSIHKHRNELENPNDGRNAMRNCGCKRNQMQRDRVVTKT